MLERLSVLTDRAVKSGAFPGGQLAWIRNGEAHVHCFGNQRYGENAGKITRGTLYDLASLTKILATTALCMSLTQSRRFRLTDRAGDFVSGLEDERLARATVKQLLSHSSGLPPWRPLYRDIPREMLGTPEGRSRLFCALKAMRTVYEPGSRAIYSDLDFMLLGLILEILEGKPLKTQAQENVFQPLKMERIAFLPMEAFPDAKIAPTQLCPWRKRELVGEVDDENTFAAGGVLGQSGLFGNADSLLPFCRELMNAPGGGGVLWSEETVRLYAGRRFPREKESFCLGFDGVSPLGSKLPKNFGPGSFGHWGFTGTGLWIDPEAKAAVILLTNRIHPTRDNQGIDHWRAPIMAAALEA